MSVNRTVAALVCLFTLFATLYSFVQTESWFSLYDYLGFSSDSRLGRDTSEIDTLSAEELRAQDKFTGDVLPRTNDVLYTIRTLAKDLKYFVYSPSGGFNNQRIEMESAMIISKILNRTLIVPAMGKHSSFYGRYELLAPSQLVPMDKIFDFRKMNEFVPCIPVGNTRLLTYVKQLESNYEIRTLLHQERLNWGEAEVYSVLGKIQAKVLFLRGAEMYHNWGFAKHHVAKMYTTVRFTEGIRRVASDCIFSAFPDGKFNAIHVRMGDYSERTPSATEYEKHMVRHGFTREIPLYIATEPSTPKSYFQDLCSKFRCFFSKDLDTPLLTEFAHAVPGGQIRHDMLGVVEQLICVAAIKFVGTSFSTFSLKITQMRKFKAFSFPEFHRPSGENATVEMIKSPSHSEEEVSLVDNNSVSSVRDDHDK